MSSYIVGDATINRIVTTLWARPQRSHLNDRLADLGLEATTDQKCQDFGQALRDLNIDAVTQRYGHSEQCDAYAFHYEPVPLIQAYKSLQCWLYQCSEGDVPKRPLFQFFAYEVKVVFADEIIGDLPAYDKAIWG